MERLTKKVENKYLFNLPSLNKNMNEWNTFFDEIVEKLGQYEDAEEQGLLLRLPCKVGDTVYEVTRDFISKYTICSIEKYNEGFFFNWRCEKGICVNARGFTNYDIGKTVFLTQEQAEETLKKIKNS